VSLERDGLGAGVLVGKECLRHHSNNPEHPRLSCHDPDECAGDNGDKDKTLIAKQIRYNILLFCLAGTDLLLVAASQPTSLNQLTQMIHLREMIRSKRADNKPESEEQLD